MTALSYLNVKADLKAQSYTLEEVFDMARQHPELRTRDDRKNALWVQGRWDHLRVRGGAIQWALLESACCESDDYVGMRSVIEVLSIGRMPNINYLKAARRVLGMN